MPGIVNESKWNRAKEIARRQGKSNNWGLVNHIYQNMGGSFKHKKSLGESDMEKSQYNKIMNDHALTHNDIVKSVMAESCGESSIQKIGSKKAIAAAKRLGTKTLKHLKTHKGKYIAGGAAAVGAGIVAAKSKKTKKSIDTQLNDIEKGLRSLAFKPLAAATRGVRRMGMSIERTANASHGANVIRTGIASTPRSGMNRAIASIGSKLRQATPKQVGVAAGIGAAGIGGAAYLRHRRNQKNRQG